MGSTPDCEINAINHGVSSRGAAGDVWPAIGRVTGTELADLVPYSIRARCVAVPRAGNRGQSVPNVLGLRLRRFVPVCLL